MSSASNRPGEAPNGQGSRITARLPGLSRKQDVSLSAWRATDDEGILRIAVLTVDEEFYSRLQQIAGSCKWRIARVASMNEVESLITEKPTPLVVYESNPEEGDWRGALRRLTGLPAHPCVLLASGVSDDNLLREVVRNHGYDILPKSAPSEKLIQCLNFAWFWALAGGRGTT